MRRANKIRFKEMVALSRTVNKTAGDSYNAGEASGNNSWIVGEEW